ncbi:MAG TPA: tetratricopeptide repeat protein [Pseudomonadales bacterium]|nr:tetratricopeptide repeat protein [Pseudomonadales bacterium]
MNQLLKYLAVALAVALLAACEQDNTNPSASAANQPSIPAQAVDSPITAKDSGFPASTVAPALPVTVDDLKIAADKGDNSAVTLLRLLDMAQRGDKEGQFQLGAAYRDGLRIRQDYAQAYQWLSKASEQNHATANFLLGAMYQFGEYVKADPEKALEYYTKAYQAGYAPAKAPVDKLKKMLKK